MNHEDCNKSTMKDQWRGIIKLFTLCITVLVGVAISECPTSTAKPVKYCPQSKEEVKIAEAKWNCEATCNTLRYHCLPDTQMRNLFEVCAEEELILGLVCAEYNTLGKIVQANRHNPKANCSNFNNTCPFAYPSTETYKYQECFLTAASTQKTKEHVNISYIWISIASIVPVILVIVIIMIIKRTWGSNISVWRKKGKPAKIEEQLSSVMAKTKSESQTPSNCIAKTNNKENEDIPLMP